MDHLGSSKVSKIPSTSSRHGENHSTSPHRPPAAGRARPAGEDLLIRRGDRHEEVPHPAPNQFPVVVHRLVGGRGDHALCESHLPEGLVLALAAPADASRAVGRLFADVEAVGARRWRHPITPRRAATPIARSFPSPSRVRPGLARCVVSRESRPSRRRSRSLAGACAWSPGSRSRVELAVPIGSRLSRWTTAG